MGPLFILLYDITTCFEPLQMSDSPTVVPSTAAITKQMDETERIRRLRSLSEKQFVDELDSNERDSDRSINFGNRNEHHDVRNKDRDWNLTNSVQVKSFDARGEKDSIVISDTFLDFGLKHLEQNFPESNTGSSLLSVRDLTKGPISSRSLLTEAEFLKSYEAFRDRRDSASTSESEALSCGASNCSRLVCVVQNLQAGQHIVVRVQARLWVDTIEKVSKPYDRVNMMTSDKEYSRSDNELFSYYFLLNIFSFLLDVFPVGHE